MKTYYVSVNFGGYVGIDEVYEVEANNEEDAIEEAREMALDDCSFEIVDVEDEEEDEE